MKPSGVSDGVRWALPRPTGVTYFIQAVAGGPIKIGVTSGDPDARAKALQVGNPHRLRVVAVIADATAERVLHKRFADWRLMGEWFSEDAPGLQEIVSEHAFHAEIEERRAA